MHKYIFAIAAATLGATAATAAPPPHTGDVLLIEQVQKEQSMRLPERGLSMAQVEAKFGAPLEKLDTRGGGARLQPPINRWRYAEFTVYFERNRVIHAVVNPPSNDPRPQA